MHRVGKHDPRIDHGSDGYGDTAQGHDVDRQALKVEHNEGHQDSHREDGDDYQGAAEVDKKDQSDKSHDQNLPEQAACHPGNGSLDQGRAIVGDLDLHAFRKSRSHLFELGLDILYHLVGICAVSHHHDAAYRFALTVPIGQPPAHLRSHRYPGQVAQQNGSSIAPHAQHDPADILQISDVTQSSDHELPLGNFQQTPTDVAVAPLNGPANLGNRNVVGPKLVGIDGDLILPDKAPYAGNLRNPRDRGKLVLQIPVLDGAELAEIVPVRFQDIHECPPDSGGIGTQSRRDPGGKALGGVVEIFQDPTAGPIDVGAVFEKDGRQRSSRRRSTPEPLW